MAALPRRHQNKDHAPEVPPPGLTSVPERQHQIRSTRAGAAWTGIAIAVVLAILLLVFILQNTTSVPVHFVGASGHFPLALGLLAATVGGALVVLVPGVIRMTQLRRTAGRHRADRHQTA
jgi:uncharacterized integral membrane protein